MNSIISISTRKESILYIMSSFRIIPISVPSIFTSMWVFSR